MLLRQREDAPALQRTAGGQLKREGRSGQAAGPGAFDGCPQHGAVAAVDAACRQMGGERLDNTQVADDWQACRDHQLPWFKARAGRALWRLSVPQTAPVLDLPTTPLVEWQGAQRWVMVDAGDAAAAGHLRRTAAAVGGSASLFIAAPADGLGATGRFDTLSAPLEQIHRALKREFDPAGILNPGRLYPGW